MRSAWQHEARRAARRRRAIGHEHLGRRRSRRAERRLRQAVDEQREAGGEQREPERVEALAPAAGSSRGRIAQRQRPARRSPIGRLMKKIQRQETSSTSQPPRIGPRIGPSSIGTPMIAITRPTRCGPAARVRIVMPAGISMPPPRPCRTRKAISDSADQARPDSTEPAQEQRDRDHVEPLGAEAVGGPAGERDDRRERERVAGDDPLDRRQRRVERRATSVLIATLTTVVSRIDMIAPSTTTPAMASTPASRPATPGRGAVDSLTTSPRSGPGSAPARARGRRARHRTATRRSGASRRASRR